ncbi:condensation domain protein [Pedosphaera parvula Ellin514]|uniref:Condensation domain protein n=2 Tax=Pedosphaera TaxID=1032526 RepID=B9XE07_PEDPL|nr:condensation domain protein [Pedosphaera parvula Ellin514]
MTGTKPIQHPLSPADAFFVAYQQGSGILMQLGFELELEGAIRRTDLEGMLLHLVGRWPQLGQKVRHQGLGLVWDGACHVEEMLNVASDEALLKEWRNLPLDPFCEPPFQLLWFANSQTHRLVVRAHHAVMDGEAMLTVYLEMMRFLSRSVGGQSLLPPVAVLPAKPMSAVELLAPLCSSEAWDHLRRMSRQAKANVSARLAVRSYAPGPTATCERLLEGEGLKMLSELAAINRTQPLWLCAAAWMRSLNGWNRASNKGSNPIISLEFPVSLRRHKASRELLGNLVSPLILSGDATQCVGTLANALKRQFIGAIRQRQHLALPQLMCPLRFLPWTLFRRLVMTPLATGAATSHFTWHENENDRSSNVSEWSHGRLQITNRRIYTPVCLHMGTALVVVSTNNSLLFSITYRLSALSAEDADKLADLLQAELMRSPMALTHQDAN